MRRALGLLCVLFACLATGCNRPPDPLDWKISGDTPGEIDVWFHENLPLMPEELAAELTNCVRNIQLLTPTGINADGKDRARNLTRRLDGKTVRAVLIEGTEIENRTLVAKLQTQADFISRFIQRNEELNAEQMSAIADRKQLMERIKGHIAKSDARLAELRGTPIP